MNAWSGKWERSIALSKKAMVLTPNYPRWCHFPIGAHLYLKGEYEQSLAESLKIELPDYYWTQVFLAMNYGQLGARTKQAQRSPGCSSCTRASVPMPGEN